MTHIIWKYALNRWTRKVLLLFAVFASLMAGPGASAQPAVINFFTATATSINAGDTVTLNWSVTGSNNLYISADANGDVGPVNFLTTIDVRPVVTTRYVLTAWTPDGTVTKALSVTVIQPLPPTISSFAASPASITAGGSSTLSWSVDGATSVSIAPDIGVVTGNSVSVSPASTTAYVLTASNPFSSSTRTISVTVQPVAAAVPVIGAFSVTPAFINPGGGATLNWAVSGADSVSISPGPGVVTGTSLAVSPPSTTLYTLTATNANGTASSLVLLGVASTGGAVSHPRVWLTPPLVAELSQRAAANDPAWLKLRDDCDTLATFTVTPPDGPTYMDNTINGEYEFSGYFNPAVKLGLCYQVAKLIDGARAAQYGAKERQLLLALSDPVHHGEPTVDSGYGIRFYVPALALAYDWTYDLLSPVERAQAYTEINRWVASYEATGFNRDFPQGNYFAGYYFAKAVGVLATEGDNPQAVAMWDDWLNRVHYGMVQPYYQQWLAGGGAPDGWNYGPVETLNMTRALLAASTAKGLDLLHDPNKPMSFPDGHARWMTHFTWPDRKTVNDRGLLYTSQPNRPSSDVSAEWATEFNGLLRGIGGDNAPIMQKFTGEVRGFSTNSSNWVEFLYWNPGAPSADYTTGPLSYRTGGDGQAAMRSSWATDAVWGAFQAGPFTGNPDAGEQFPDQGSLAIQRGNIQLLVNADGALTTPTPGTEDTTESGWTALFNDVHGTNTDGVVNASKNFNTYHAKILADAMYPGSSAGYWGEVSAGPGDSHTTLSRFEEGNQYVLMRGASLGDMFMTGVSPVTGWSRDVAYVRPQLFVVYDRTSVNNTNTDDWMAWHVVSTPTEQAGAPGGTHRFDVLDTRPVNGGNLFRGRVSTVLPDGHKVDIVDIEDNGIDPTEPTPDNPDGDPGRPPQPMHKVYRLEVRRADASAGQATWLTVFDASNSPAAAGSAAPLTLANGGVRAGDVEGTVISGVNGGNVAVLFSKSGAAVPGTVSIALPLAATYCLISDLPPGAGYAVSSALVNGAVVLSVAPGGSFTTTSQGSLSFSLDNTGTVIVQ